MGAYAIITGLNPVRIAKTAKIVAAIVLLNASLTFQNRWPTPAIRWQNALSIELAALVLALALASQWRGRPSRLLLNVLAALFVVLVISRYAFVTAPALYGRDVNLYWDMRFIPDVAAMLTRAAPLWIVISIVAGALLVLGLLFALLRWALARVGDAIADARGRRVLGVVAAALVVVFTGQQLSARVPRVPTFTVPLTESYLDQLRYLRDAITRSKSLPESPAMDSDLSLVKGADVYLVFLESYGAVTYERPEMAARLVESRARFESDLTAGNRHVVSAFVESPTFGGNSWLAHLSLLSGVEVKDEDTNWLLMGQKRETLVKAFTHRGFRAVGLMPGQRETWPEGAFYGFDDIYGIERLAYHGPAFGWFVVPDQWSLARLDALEAHRTQPLFVMFPTMSTHIPFIPLPPYQPDWSRMLTGHPYDAADQARELAREPEWLNMGLSYTEAVAYDFTVLGGYLRAHADRDIVMIVLGDHQPAAVVSGEGAPWDVPVHIIASRQEILDRLVARGFRAGLTPSRPSLSHMHALLPVLLDAFGNREAR